MTTSIKTRAMLARLRISMWSGRVTDDSISMEVSKAHGAAADAGRYVKQLINSPAMKAIGQVQSAARGFHMVNTLPWEDGGSRVLPARNFLPYSERIALFSDEFDTRMEEFIEVYPELRDEAKGRLNGLFDPADFPEPHELRRKFGLTLQIWGMPDAADFRVDVGDEHVRQIRHDIENATQEKLAEGHADLWRRLHGVVSHMAGQLRAAGTVAAGGTKKSPFRDSTVENVRELAELLPRLNVAEDPQLEAMAKRVVDDLCDLDGGAFRASDRLREKYTKTAEEILADMAGYTGVAP